jgi:hypothetical protein
MEKIRHYQRYTVLGSGVIYRTSIQNVAFSINDISASGMNIITEADLEKDVVISMEIQVSGNILPYKKQIKGRIIRKSKCDSIFNYGIQFMDLPNRDIIEIDEYLRLNYSNTAPHRTSYDTGNDENPLRQLSRKTNI